MVGESRGGRVSRWDLIDVSPRACGCVSVCRRWRGSGRPLQPWMPWRCGWRRSLDRTHPPPSSPSWYAERGAAMGEWANKQSHQSSFSVVLLFSSFPSLVSLSPSLLLSSLSFSLLIPSLLSFPSLLPFLPFLSLRLASDCRRAELAAARRLARVRPLRPPPRAPRHG